MRDRDHSVAREASPESASAVKLSELSVEERMAYYKQKYDKSGSHPAGGNRREKPGRRNQHKGRGRHPGGESAARDSHQAQEKARPAQSETPAPAQGSEKKGLLSKLFGVFRKK